MYNNKKLSEELLKIDGIDPATISEVERAKFRKMLDEEIKRFNRLSWCSIGVMGIFVAAMLGLCMSERVLEALHIPFGAAWAMLLIGIYAFLFMFWPKHYKLIKESGKKIQRLHLIAYGRDRGFPLVGKKNGKRCIDWLSIITLVIAHWLLIALGGAGVYYLLCRSWIFSSHPGFIIYSIIASLAFVMPLLYFGLRAPLEELPEIKKKKATVAAKENSH